MSYPRKDKDVFQEDEGNDIPSVTKPRANMHDNDDGVGENYDEPQAPPTRSHRNRNDNLAPYDEEDISIDEDSEEDRSRGFDENSEDDEDLKKHKKLGDEDESSKHTGYDSTESSYVSTTDPFDEGVKKPEPPKSQPRLSVAKVLDKVFLKGDSHMDKIYLYKDGRNYLYGFLVVIFIAFAFSLTATTTVPWFGAGKTGRQFGIWKAKGGGQADVKVSDITTCSDEQQYWQGMQAFSIISTVTTMLAFVTGVMCRFGIGHIGIVMGICFWSIISSVGGWGLAIGYYYYNRCGKGSMSTGIAKFHAGFALTLTSSLLSIVGLVLLCIFSTTAYRGSRTYRVRHWMRWVFLMICALSVILIVVGAARNFWTKDFPTKIMHVSMWHTEVYERNLGLKQVFGRHLYKCKSYNRYMAAVSVFVILSGVLVYVTLLAAVAAVYRKTMYMVSNILGIISFVLQLVSVAIALNMYNRDFCEVVGNKNKNLWIGAGYNGVPNGISEMHISFDGYHIAEGLGMIIAAWIIMVLGVIFNFIVGYDNGANYDDMHDPFAPDEEESYHYSVMDPMEVRDQNDAGEDPFYEGDQNRNDPFVQDKPEPEGGWGENEPFYSETRPNRARRDFAPVGADEDVDAAYNMMVGTNIHHISDDDEAFR